MTDGSLYSVEHEYSCTLVDLSVGVIECTAWDVGRNRYL